MDMFFLADKVLHLKKISSIVYKTGWFHIRIQMSSFFAKTGSVRLKMGEDALGSKVPQGSGARVGKRRPRWVEPKTGKAPTAIDPKAFTAEVS